MTKLCAIVATAENNAIGKGNDLLWHLPEDFKHFKRTTMAKPLIMGRKTFQSLPGILPGRPHIIITRQGFEHDGVAITGSIDEAIQEAQTHNTDEIFIIGGAQIYEQTLPLIDRLYLTRVHQNFDGDAFFPELNMNEWDIAESSEHEHNGLTFTIMTLNRKA